MLVLIKNKLNYLKDSFECFVKEYSRLLIFLKTFFGGEGCGIYNNGKFKS